MADTRKSVTCEYCGASFTVKWDTDELNLPEFCCWCGESFIEPALEDENEDEEEDIPYEADENDMN